MEEEFPQECVEEVREERRDPEFALPACSVNVTLGLSGEQKLYVVLPTEIRPDLPFSFSAPLIQDPSRTRIKDPSISPTNRWLLKRVGTVAAQAMERWAGNSGLTLNERADAYQLLPDPNAEGHSIDSDCTQIVIDAFRAHVEQSPVVLTHDGGLAPQGDCLSPPLEISRVWSPSQLLDLFGKGHHYVLAEQVHAEARPRLADWNLVTPLSRDNIESRLRNTPYPPLPSEDGLLDLWAFLEESVRRFPYYFGSCAIVPVIGQDTLFPTERVFVIGTSERTLSEADWQFLCEYVPLVSPDWVEMIESAKKPQSGESATSDSRLQLAANVYRLLDIDRHVNLGKIIATATKLVFESYPGDKGLALALIAARADVAVPEDFQYKCAGGKWYPIANGRYPNRRWLLTGFCQRIGSLCT